MLEIQPYPIDPSGLFVFRNCDFNGNGEITTAQLQPGDMVYQILGKIQKYFSIIFKFVKLYFTNVKDISSADIQPIYHEFMKI